MGDFLLREGKKRWKWSHLNFFFLQFCTKKCNKGQDITKDNNDIHLINMKVKDNPDKAVPLFILQVPVNTVATIVILLSTG